MLFIQVIIKKSPIDVCCDGYVASNRKCKPVCTSDCIHGTCIEPDKCKCEPGYGGPTCSICKFLVTHFCDIRHL